jgi:hypothetical protein
MRTNLTITAKHLDWTVNDLLLCFPQIPFHRIDKYIGGFQDDLWAAVSDMLDDRYRDDLFQILRRKATDCYLYEQIEDFPATIYRLEDLGWKAIC